MSKSTIIKILIVLAIICSVIGHVMKSEAAEGYTDKIGYPTNYNAEVYGNWIVNLDSIQKEYEYVDPNGNWYIAACGDVIDRDNYVVTWHVQNYNHDGVRYSGKGLLVTLNFDSGMTKCIELPDGDLSDFRVANCIIMQFYKKGYKIWNN